MKEEIKNLIAAARSAYPDMRTVQRLCEELEKSAQFNEDTLAIKIGLAEENQRLRAEKEELHRESSLRQRTIDQMKASGYPITASQNLLEQLLAQTEKLLNPAQVVNPQIPPMSPECFRQNAAMAALNGLLTNPQQGGSTTDIAKYAAKYADALVKELAK